MKVLNALFYVAGSLTIITLPFLVINWLKYAKVLEANRSKVVPIPTRFPLKSVFCFVGSGLIAVAIAVIVTSYARVEALDYLRDLSGSYQVYVNSQPTHYPEKIVAALKEVVPQLGHHSHPTKMIRVEIRSEKSNLTLELGRDSGHAQQYWVFYPKYHLTSNNEIGRVTTTVFDEY